MKPGPILIRADASVAIGTGHVMRCLALAQAWQDGGGKAVFAMASATRAMETRLAVEQCESVSIPAEGGSCEDAKQTIERARQLDAEWIVVDGYNFDGDYQQQIKNAGFNVLCLDDIGLSKHYPADLILNQNIHANEDLYRNREGYTRCLLGPRFVLLRREFLDRPQAMRSTAEAGRGVLVMMGGTDPENVSAKVMNAAISLSGESLELVVVAGGGNPHIEELERLASRSKGAVRVVKDPDSIPELMLWADLAISAAGSTVWEMCWLGLPAILITLAKNQEPGAAELARRGIALCLGSHEQLDETQLIHELRELVHSRERRQHMAQLGQELIDGKGCQRVLTAMQSSILRLRRANRDDAILLWRWVNEPAVRAASFQTRPISLEEHAAWFAGKINAEQAAIYVAEDHEGTPVGQFRVEWGANKEAKVDISIAPDKRGCGIAATLIARATHMASRDVGLQRFHAYIRPENHASIRAFEKAGFSNFERVGETIHCRKDLGAVR